jgi:hypothetical protein
MSLRKLIVPAPMTARCVMMAMMVQLMTLVSTGFVLDLRLVTSLATQVLASSMSPVMSILDVYSKMWMMEPHVTMVMSLRFKTLALPVNVVVLTSVQQ